MNFVSRIARAPRAHDPGRGAEAAALFPDLPGELREVIGGAAGCSPFLKLLAERERDWLAGALSGVPEDAFARLLGDVAALEDAALGPGLRRIRGRVALFCGLADLAGVWPLETVTGALTDFADRAVDRAVRAEVAAEIRRGKLPGAREDDAATAGGLAVLAMGKMGAGELNYSSDIDLICLFDDSRYAEDDFAEARSALVRATRRMSALLSDHTGEGYVFRTDLRLRPDPSVTAVCVAMEAAERYYESLGRTWERAAYIKARAAAGDVAAGEAFLDRLTPFIWRKHLDYAAIQDAHDMRLRIRAHKGLFKRTDLAGHDMKLGPGGIREIEFFTQTRQIIAGGRDRDLRVRGTVEGLARLAEKGWVPAAEAEQLTADYRAHREVEHRLQQIADQQTHALPRDGDGFDRLAALMDMSRNKLEADLTERLGRVADLTEGFFEPARSAATTQMSPETAEIVARWPRYPALRSARAVEIFERVRPELLRRLERAARPDTALVHIDGFLAGLPAGVQLFSLFEANPQLIDLVVDIADTAPELALYLARNAGVFDAVIGGAFFSDWPGGAALRAELAGQLADAGDYEAQLDTARRWAKEWRFRIGVHLLRGLIDARAAGRQYADLAEAVVAALWDPVVAAFSDKHGPPPGLGAAVLAMGSLGAGRLSSTSDLDLIVIYDPAGAEASDGRRPLAARAYYARLTQALVTALSAPMAEGKLYEVDMRLRPSGRQGPVATSFASFCNYQRTEAWTWEHLALTRARPIAGAEKVGAAVEAFRVALLSEPRERAGVLRDVADMRARLADAKPGTGGLSAKQGPGRIQDIELIAETAALLAGSPLRDIAGQIAVGAEALCLSAGQIAELTQGYELLWHVQVAGRLLGDPASDAIGAGGEQFLLRGTGAGRLADLLADIDARAAGSAAIIDEILGRVAAPE